MSWLAGAGAAGEAVRLARVPGPDSFFSSTIQDFKMRWPAGAAVAGGAGRSAHAPGPDRLFFIDYTGVWWADLLLLLLEVEQRGGLMHQGQTHYFSSIIQHFEMNWPAGAGAAGGAVRPEPDRLFFIDYTEFWWTDLLELVLEVEQWGLLMHQGQTDYFSSTIQEFDELTCWCCFCRWSSVTCSCARARSTSVLQCKTFI